MNRKTFSTMLIIGMVWTWALCSSAIAEIQAGSFTVSPMAGGYAFDDEKDLLDLGKDFSMGLGYNFTDVFGAELGFSYIHTDADMCCNRGNVYAYQPRFDLLFHLMPNSSFVPYVAMGVSGLFFDDDDISPAEIDDTVQAGGGLGVKFFLSDNVALRADGRYYYGFENSESEYALTAGLYFQFGGEPPVSEPCADEDVDGVCDDADKCPGTPAGIHVEADGCPPKSQPYTNLKKSSDSAQSVVSSDQPPPVPEMMKVVVLFDFDRTEIKSEYFGDLEALARFMTEYPEIGAIVEGHTDSIGSSAYNQRLSEKRAASIRGYMSEHYGISPDRFELAPYGESRPAAANNTRDGRKQNRRAVTITIME